MAGYLFSLGNSNGINALMNSIEKGIYSTIIKEPENGWNGSWNSPQEGTFADYASMKEGDNVYFFIDRKIYGIGTLININGDCKFLNYHNANQPLNHNYEDVNDLMLFDDGTVNSINFRFLCTFIPYPVFFKNGIDMDEMLSSSPNSFKILRTFEKLSFIKFPDEENQAFKNIILRRNIDAINNPNNSNTFESNYQNHHLLISQKTANNNLYQLSPIPFLNTIVNDNGSLRHEMAVEAAIIFQLSTNHLQTIEVFSNWDYLSHQVIASPFKPIIYIDKIDVFGYKFINNEIPTIGKYLVIEIKKGRVGINDILQLMKYVDWVKSEYAFGDYNMINAFIVGHSFTNEVMNNLEEMVERKFIANFRPPTSHIWNNVKLVSYSFNAQTNLLDFEIVAEVNG
jgi:hypothetical protein